MKNKAAVAEASPVGVRVTARMGRSERRIKEGKFKYGDSPRLTSACRLALEHLKLDLLTLVCPADEARELGDKARVRGLSRLVSEGKLT